MPKKALIRNGVKLSTIAIPEKTRDKFKKYCVNNDVGMIAAADRILKDGIKKPFKKKK